MRSGGGEVRVRKAAAQDTHLIGRPGHWPLVFGWGRRKKKGEGSKVRAAADEAASGGERGGRGGHGQGARSAGGYGGPRTDRIDPADITVPQVEGVVAEIVSVQEAALVAGAASLREALLPRMEKMSAIVEELADDDLDTEDADRRLQAIVDRGKQQIISIIGQEVRATVPEVRTADDAVALGESTARMLKRTGDVLGRQTRVIHVFAKRYAGRIKPVLESTRNDLDVLQSLIAGRTRTVESADRIRADIGRIGSAEALAARLRARAGELDGALQGLRRRGQSLSADIASVKASPEYEALEGLRRQLESAGADRGAARHEMRDRFTKISRPLSRYEYVSAMDKERIALLRAVIEDPFEAVASAGAGPVAEILQAVRKAVNSGSISVKDPAKAVQLLDEEAGRLDGAARTAAEIGAREDGARARMAEADTGRLARLEADLEKNAAEISDTEAKVRQMRAEAGEADERIPKIVSAIEWNLRQVSGVRYSVSLGR